MKKCKCEWCVKWCPIHRRVRLTLKGKLLKDFDALMAHYDALSMDGDVSKAKLNGSWPGWEWLPEAIRAHAAKRS